MLQESIVLSFSVFECSKVVSALYEFDDIFNAEQVRDELIFADTKAMVIFSDGLKSDVEIFLNPISKLKPEMLIAGGRAGDTAFEATYVFNGERWTDKGCVIATLSGSDLIATNDYIFNWTPIGKEMEVTKCEDNVLYELDGTPVVDIYEKYLGKDVVENMPASCMPFPLVTNQEGVLIGRDPIAVIDNNALAFGGKFEVGEKVRFSFANIEDLVDNIDMHFDKYRKTPAESVYIYSCTARKVLLKDKLTDELNLLNSLAPSVGFFTFGEFFHFGEIAELLNVTTTFMMLSESDTVVQKELQKGSQYHFDPIRKALTHLVKVTAEELESVSMHDSLTGIYNRSEYKRILEKKIKSAQRYGDSFGLILMDIDFFKEVNDMHGHDVGDVVLKNFAAIVQEHIREDDFVARWGGEEFIVIANYTGEQELERLAKKLQEAIAKASFAPAAQLTASFGLSIYKEGDTKESLFKRVDKALYTAKQTGRNKYVII
jgi:diguanylate cyclase (GGDEF)-like protein